MKSSYCHSSPTRRLPITTPISPVAFWRTLWPTVNRGVGMPGSLDKPNVAVSPLWGGRVAEHDNTVTFHGDLDHVLLGLEVLHLVDQPILTEIPDLDNLPSLLSSVVAPCNEVSDRERANERGALDHSCCGQPLTVAF